MGNCHPAVPDFPVGILTQRLGECRTTRTPVVNTRQITHCQVIGAEGGTPKLEMEPGRDSNKEPAE